MVSRNLERANENDGSKMTALEIVVSNYNKIQQTCSVKRSTRNKERGSYLVWHLIHTVKQFPIVCLDWGHCPDVCISRKPENQKLFWRTMRQFTLFCTATVTMVEDPVLRFGDTPGCLAIRPFTTLINSGRSMDLITLAMGRYSCGSVCKHEWKTHTVRLKNTWLYAVLNRLNELDGDMFTD